MDNKKEITIGIGDIKISDNENTVLRTYALSSCIAVTAYSPSKKIAGMVHIALPKPISEWEGRDRPAYYASTAVPMLINKMCVNYGCKKGELQIRLFGGAESIRDDDYFRIGKLNIDAVHIALHLLNLSVHKSETGGNHSRTLIMYVSDGSIKVSYHPIKI